MPWQHIFLLLTSVFICVVLAIFAWQRRTALGARPFMVMMGAMVFWTVSYILELVSRTYPVKLFWLKMEYMGIIVVPIAWLLFALEFSGFKRWVTPRNILIICILPIVNALIIWTDGVFHHLFWQEIRMVEAGSAVLLDYVNATGFALHAAYSYLLLTLGLVLMIRTAVRKRGFYRQQAIFMVVGALAPIIPNLLVVFGANPLDPLDLTPFAFTISGIFMASAFLRYRLMDIVPIARSAIIDGMQDIVLVLDLQSRIIDYNPAMAAVLNLPADEMLGKPADEVFQPWPELLAQYGDVIETQSEVSVQQDEYFDFRISPLTDQSGELIGRLIVLRDITKRKLAENALLAQKQLFENLVAVARATSERLALEATLRNVLNVSMGLTEAERGSLFLLDPDGNVTHSILARGEAQPVEQSFLVGRAMDRGLAGWVVRNHEAVLVKDVFQETRWVPLADETYQPRSALIVPVAGMVGTVGVLTLEHSQVSHFHDNHLVLIQSACDQMALTLRNAQMFEEQSQLANREAALNRVLQTVGEHLDPQVALQVAVDTVAEITGWPLVAIVLLDRSGEFLELLAAGGRVQPESRGRISVQNGILGRAYRTGETQYVPDVEQDPDYMAGNVQICSEVSVPLRRGERIIGVLDVESDRVAAFKPSDITLFESMGEAIALTLENVQLYDETKQRLREQEILRQASETLTSTLDFDVILCNLAEQMCQMVGATSAYINTFDTNEMQSTVIAEYIGPEASPKEQESDLGITYTEDDVSFAESFLTGKAEYYHFDEHKLSESEREHLNYYGCKTVLLIPIQVREEIIAFAEIWETRQKREYRDAEIDLCQSIAQQAAVALERARLFDELVDAKEVAEQANQAKTDFISLVAHELKIPMTSIKGYAELLADGVAGSVTPNQKELLGVIRSNINRMANQVSDLADISRIESGRVRLDLKPLSLGEVVNETVHSVQAQIDQKEHDVQIDFSANLPDIMADSARMVQVMTNLLSNAIKYTPAGGQITVEAQLSDQADGVETVSDMVTVSITDTGFGIKPTEQVKIFSQFFRSEDDQVRVESGTGLGLNITKLLVELQGGEIWFESEYQKGSTFYFTVPVAAE